QECEKALAEQAPKFKVLAKGKISFRGEAIVKVTYNRVTIVGTDYQAKVDLTGLIDVPAELKRLEKQKAEKEKQLAGLRGKLRNASFVEKASPEVVQQSREQETDLVRQLATIAATIAQLRS